MVTKYVFFFSFQIMNDYECLPRSVKCDFAMLNRFCCCRNAHIMPLTESHKTKQTMESTAAHLQNLYDKLWTQVDLLNENIEPSK